VEISGLADIDIPINTNIRDNQPRTWEFSDDTCVTGNFWRLLFHGPTDIQHGACFNQRRGWLADLHWRLGFTAVDEILTENGLLQRRLLCRGLLHRGIEQRSEFGVLVQQGLVLGRKLLYRGFWCDLLFGRRNYGRG